MTEKEIYSELSERYIIAAINNINNINEAAGFECYHAFESLAGAFNSYLGQTVSKSHHKKIGTFATNYNTHPITRINPNTIAGFAIKLMNLRNLYLYPENNNGHYTSPKDQMTKAQIQKLISQVNSIIQKINNAIL